MVRVAVIVLDTLRRDGISPYNNAIDHTPHLETFSKSATTYTNAVTQAPWSFPSQSSLLTGLYPWQHGGSQSQPYVQPTAPLLQRRLGEAGCYTRAIHNNTWLVPVTGAMDGFHSVTAPSEWSKYARRPWRWGNRNGAVAAAYRRLLLSASRRELRSSLRETTDSTDLLDGTSEFLADHGDEDFFLYLNLVNTHYPYTPPDEYRRRHGVERSCFGLDSRPLEYGGPVVASERDALERLYAAEVDYLDDVFGEVVEEFRRRGLYEDTLFVVASDHGELLGEAGQFGHHFSVRPELTHVPLFVKRPNVRGGTCNEVTELREMHYEVLDHAGVDAVDEAKLSDGVAAGIYQEPVIYRNRVPEERPSHFASQLYLVDDDRSHSVHTVDSARVEHSHGRLRDSLRNETDVTAAMNRYSRLLQNAT